MMGFLSWLAWLRIRQRIRQSSAFCRKAQAKRGNEAWGESRLGLDSYSDYPKEEKK
jgi:hypothetical protein